MFDFNLLVGLNAITPEDVSIVICRDLENLSTETEKFYNNNIDAYSVVLNLWLHLISDNADPISAEVVKRDLLDKGLTATIKSATVSNIEVISGLEPTSMTWKIVLDQVRKKYGIRNYGFGFLTESRVINPVIFRVFNTLTKFPKRFTPVGADKLDDRTWKDFRDNQNRMSKEWAENDTPHRAYYLELMRGVVRRMMPWRLICKKVRAVMEDPDAYSLTPGVCADTKRPMVYKIKEIRKFSMDRGYQHKFSGFKFTGNWKEDTYSRGMIVPKNNETGRVISPEEAVRAAKGKRVFEILEKFVPENINIRDQEVNQLTALLGSSKQQAIYDTLDQSKASDSVIWPLFYEILPTEFTELVTPLLAQRMEFPQESGKRERKRIMTAMAMGHPLTFIIECILFLASGICGALLSSPEMTSVRDVLLPKKVVLNGQVIWLPKIAIVGDDMALLTEYTEATMHILEVLGFLLNKEKSYTGDHPYRESCGKEYFEGEDVTAIYYPRSPLGVLNAANGGLRWEYNIHTGTSEPKDNLARLVEMQHRLYVWSYHANEWIVALIRRLLPNMTESQAGSTFSDIWTQEPVITKKYSPYAYITEYYTESSSKRTWVRREDVVSYPAHQFVGTDEVAWESAQKSKEFWENLHERAVSMLRVTVDSEELAEPIFDCKTRTELQIQADFFASKVEQFQREMDKCRGRRYDYVVYRLASDPNTEVYKADSTHLIPLPPQEDSYLEGHSYLSATFPQAAKLSTGDVETLLDWCYYNFLKNGPEYAHPRDTLEGQIEREAGITTNMYVTKAGNPRNNLSGEVKLIWKI